MSKKSKKSRRGRPGKKGVEALPARFDHLNEAAATANALTAPTAETAQVAVDFEPQAGDEDVSGKSDSELGHSMRMKAERGNGAWLFEALDANAERRRWLREVPRA